MIKNFLSRCTDDHNFGRPFDELKPEQRLVNILFDEVKLVGGLRYSDRHTFGYAKSNPIKTDTIAATLVIETVCNYGGPRYVLRVPPIAKLNASEQHQMLLDANSGHQKKEGIVISLISYNAPTNVKTFKLMSGPGNVTLEHEGQVYLLFLVYDLVHLFKNI